jgi:hypothetical protein
MSTVLFLNTDKPLPKKILGQKGKFSFEKITERVKILQETQRCKLEGYNYFFGSMWVPLSTPLSFYKQWPKMYEAANNYIVWIKEIITYLLAENFRVKLILNSIGEEKWELQGGKTIRVSEIDENIFLDYAVLYNLALNDAIDESP